MLPPSDPMAACRARREDELAQCVEVFHGKERSAAAPLR